MKYSQKLITRVKMLFPDCPLLQKMAENGDIKLGYHLAYTFTIGIDCGRILSVKTLQEFYELKRYTQQMLNRHDLYIMWQQECNANENKFEELQVSAN